MLHKCSLLVVTMIGFIAVDSQHDNPYQLTAIDAVRHKQYNPQEFTKQQCQMSKNCKLLTKIKKVCGGINDKKGYIYRIFNNHCDMYHANCYLGSRYLPTVMEACEIDVNYKEDTVYQNEYIRPTPVEKHRWGLAYYP